MSAVDGPWTTGFELELLAPLGSDRRTLAAAIAARHPSATVERCFHMESEPSAVPDQPVFHNLTLGYEVRVAQGWVARCLDDLTLQADLDRRAAPKPGWFRIVSDDPRLLSLARLHAGEGTLEDIVAPIAALFGTSPEPGSGGMLRVVDGIGSSVLIAAPLPGERERPCELVTPPLGADLAARLGELVATARELGFTVPREAALHIHFDAKRLRDARVFAALIRFFGRHSEALKDLVGTNPSCRRLGHWPPALVATAQAADFPTLAWDQAAERLRATELSKYCDFNVMNIVLAPPDKDTFEVRILPVSLDLQVLLAIAELFEAMLRALVSDTMPDGDLPDVLATLPLSAPTRAHWLDRAR